MVDLFQNQSSMEQVAHSNQVKLKALREVIKGEKTIFEISEECDVSEDTIEHWVGSFMSNVEQLNQEVSKQAPVTPATPIFTKEDQQKMADKIERLRTARWFADLALELAEREILDEAVRAGKIKAPPAK